MSHFATVKTQIKDKQALITALRALNLESEEGNQIEMKTQWSGNEKHFVDIVVRGKALGCGADVGFKLQTGEIVADDWELKRSAIRNFRQRLIEEYSVAVAVKSGYRVVGRSVSSDGKLQLQLEEQIQVRR